MTATTTPVDYFAGRPEARTSYANQRHLAARELGTAAACTHGATLGDGCPACRRSAAVLLPAGSPSAPAYVEPATVSPTAAEVARYTDEQLEASADALELAEEAADEDGDEELAARIGKARQLVERELDARELWNSDDARVRESVGNYRP